jgi:hypothetical protein
LIRVAAVRQDQFVDRQIGLGQLRGRGRRRGLWASGQLLGDDAGVLRAGLG